MSEKKHIDRLFQEKFKDFEVAPDNTVWNRIEKDLPKKKKKRRTVLLWWQLGGVAAAILLLLTVGISLLQKESSQKELPVVNTESDLPDATKTDDTTNRDQFDKQSQSRDDSNAVADSNDNGEIFNEDSNSSSGYSEENSSPKQNIVNNKANRISKKSLTDKTKTIVDVGSVKEKAPSASKTIEDVKNPNEEVIKESIKNTQRVVAKNLDENKPKNSEGTVISPSEKTDPSTPIDIKEEVKKQSIQEAIAEQDNLLDEKEKVEQSRWSISPNVAPVYFSSLGQGSAINDQFNENTKGGDINMSYGISGSYAINDRLKVRVGINSVNLNQTTADVFTFNGVEADGAARMSQMDNIKLQESSSSLAIMSSALLNGVAAPEIFNANLSGELEQRFGFIEIPMELEYRILDSKFGVNLIGGFSTLFLNNNELFADVDGVSTLIGEASNINTTSFSANFGLGMDYSLSKQWNINLEPMFKYQINTFNNTSGQFRPFFIGVYSGIRFKF